MRPTAVLAGVALALVAWGEWENWVASRRLTHPGQDGAETIVVLGFRNRTDRANAVNRWRVRAALRSIDPQRPTTLVFSGGDTGGGVPEARLLADYARQRGFRGKFTLEDTSQSTWENITNVVPLIEDADRIKIVSNSTHALKARVYLARQRPDLAARVVRGADYRFGEWFPLKPLLAAYGRWKLRGLRSTMSTTSTGAR